MRLSLRQLQIFLAVAQCGSTTAAATALALSQSATSAALNELESLLDIILFDRVGKRLVINDNGRVLLPQAREMLDAAATIEKQFGRHAALSGNGLNLGASTTIGIYVLPPLLAAAFGKHAANPPLVKIRNTAEIAAAVANFELDLGFIEGPCTDAALEVAPWRTDELLVVGAPDHPLALQSARREVTLDELRAAHWLLREPGSGTRDAVEQALAPYLHSLRSAGEFSNAEAIKHGAAEGLGLACLSRLIVADFLANGRLVALSTALPPLTRHFFIVYHRRKLLSPRLQAFLTFCRTEPVRSHP